MAKIDIKDILYGKKHSALDFKFNSLTAPPLSMFFNMQDFERLYNIATSIKYTGKIQKKYQEIDYIMKARGFVKFASGTNRVVYRPLEDNSFVIKIPIDKVGLEDNPAEYNNQFLLQPFVTRVFEVAPGNALASFERVQPIISRLEFEQIAGDVFDLIVNKFIGKYILEDIGSKYFMNWALRTGGFGPVLLDFPYVFELDGNKLYCNHKIMGSNIACGGEIDYDNGFNNLICKKCGKLYMAKELKSNKNNNIIMIKEGEINMNVKLVRGNEVIRQSGNNSDIIITNKQLVVNPNETFDNMQVAKKVKTPLFTVMLLKEQVEKPIQEETSDPLKENLCSETPINLEEKEVADPVISNEEDESEELILQDSVDNITSVEITEYVNVEDTKPQSIIDSGLESEDLNAEQLAEIYGIKKSDIDKLYDDSKFINREKFSVKKKYIEIKNEDDK